MGTLKDFESVSGLKVNTEKTKVIKIGAARDNRINLCTDLNLIWTDKFTSLGITYNINEMEHITEQNLEIKEKEIEKLIHVWSGRNITPLGKITIIKSLLISKITHILLSLPSPKTGTFKKFEQVFESFIWKGKPPKIRGEILEATHQMGGLKMTNLKLFDQSLKASWLKRLKDESDGWEELPRKYRIENILIFGDSYTKTLLKRIEDPFWKDVVKACQTIQSKSYDTGVRAFNMPLWYNSRISINFRKDWLNMGYHKLSDILDRDGKIMSLEECYKEGSILIFWSIKKLRYDISNLNLIHHNNVKLGPYLPYFLFKIGHDGKGCSKSYNLLLSTNFNIILSVQEKWENILGKEIKIETIMNSFKNIHRIREDSFTRYLQFRILHKRVFTNKNLFDMGIKDNNLSPHCKEYVETFEHAFLQCTMVKQIWNDIETWLKRNVDNHLKLTDREKIFGVEGKNENIVMKTIIATKRVIYRNRQIPKEYTMREVKALLKCQMQNEEYQAGIENSFENFQKTWEQVYNLL